MTCDIPVSLTFNPSEVKRVLAVVPEPWVMVKDEPLAWEIRRREPSPSGMTDAVRLVTLLVIWVARSARLVPPFTVIDPKTAPAADEVSRKVSVSVVG